MVQLKKIICILTFLVIVLSLVSCNYNVKVSLSYSDSDFYVDGNTTYKTNGLNNDVEDSSDAKKITTLDIEWVNGDVTIEESEDDLIHIEEIGNDNKNDKIIVRSLHKNNELKIKYSYPGKFDFSKTKRDLKVYIPKDYDFSAFNIDLVNGDVKIKSTSKKVSLNVVNTNIEIINSEEIVIDGVNTDVKINSEIVKRLEINSTNLTLNLKSSSIKDIDIDVVNGNIELNTIDRGFKMELDSLSKTITSDFDYETENGKYVYGDKDLDIDIDGVSITLKINKITGE